MRKYTMIAGAALTAALAAGCSTHSASSATSPFKGPSASALASVPGADAKQVLIRAGVPVNGTSAQQLAFGRAMMVQANRQTLAAKLAIPAGPKRNAFEAALVTAAKGDHVLTSHQGRVKFLDQDVENIYVMFA